MLRFSNRFIKDAIPIVVRRRKIVPSKQSRLGHVAVENGSIDHSKPNGREYRSYKFHMQLDISKVLYCITHTSGSDYGSFQSLERIFSTHKTNTNPNP